MYIPHYIEKVLNILYQNGYEGYLVGGCVRDSLMGKIPHDYDLTTNALPDEIINCFKDYRVIETGIKHGTVTVVSDGENVEITTYRIDGVYNDNRHPEKVNFTKNIHEDLSRRDFTVNAIAYSPRDGFVDVFGGIDDIKNKIIRCVGCPDTRFKEDGLRIMRAIRFSSVLDFDIDKSTSLSVHKNGELLNNISAERKFSEFKKLICGKKSVAVLHEYYDIMCIVFSELKKYEKQYKSNLGALKTAVSDEVCACTILFYSMDIQDIKAMIRALKTDNKFYSDTVTLSEIVRSDLGYDKYSVRYIMKKIDDQNIKRLSEIKTAVCPDFSQEMFLNQYYNQRNEGACVKIGDLQIDGTAIIGLGVKKGPVIGDILEKLLCAVIEDKCINEYEHLKNYILAELSFYLDM